MNRHIRNTIIAMFLLLGVPAIAGQGDLLMLLPGFPGTSAQAQPYVDKMLRYLEGELGWEANSMSGLFIPDGAKATAKLSEVKPGVALMGPSIYAMNHKSTKMKVIAKVHANGRGEQTYYIVTKKDGPADLKSLEGKTLSGVVTHDEKFVFNVLLDKKAPATIKLVKQKRPLKSLRDLAKGKTDAALIDQETKDHMGDLDFAGDLQVIHTSAPVPAPAVVVLNDGIKHAPALKKALTGLCKTAEGKELCKSLTLTSLTPASDKDYKKLLKKYNR